MRKPPRYRVIRVSANEANLVDHLTNDVTAYWRPLAGGYVYDVTYHEGTLGQQVCDGLASRGSTLTCGEREELTDVIRREARKAYKGEMR